MKGTWKILNTIIRKGNISSNYPDSFIHNGATVKNKQDIANGFNDFFKRRTKLYSCMSIYILVCQLVGVSLLPPPCHNYARDSQHHKVMEWYILCLSAAMSRRCVAGEPDASTRAFTLQRQPDAYRSRPLRTKQNRTNTAEMKYKVYTNKLTCVLRNCEKSIILNYSNKKKKM